MPYIKIFRRKKAATQPQTAGELNFAISELLNGFIQRTRLSGVVSYEDFNTAVGACELAKQEFIRRRVVPYEEGKMRSNGDLGRYALDDPRPPTQL